MVLDCLIGKIQPIRDLLIGQTAPHHFNELLFSPRQTEGMSSLQTCRRLCLRTSNVFKKYATEAWRANSLIPCNRTNGCSHIDGGRILEHVSNHPSAYSSQKCGWIRLHPDQQDMEVRQFLAQFRNDLQIGQGI